MATNPMYREAGKEGTLSEKSHRTRFVMVKTVADFHDQSFTHVEDSPSHEFPDRPAATRSGMN